MKMAEHFSNPDLYQEVVEMIAEGQKSQENLEAEVKEARKSVDRLTKSVNAIKLKMKDINKEKETIKKDIKLLQEEYLELAEKVTEVDSFFYSFLFYFKINS